MKNKLLVSVFALAIASFALVSCETESNVKEVCSDMIKESMRKTPRSLLKLDGQTLTMYEYEFVGGVDDNRLLYRTIAFGNGVNSAKQVDTLSFQYGEWNENSTAFSLLVTPKVGDPYTLWYKGNALITPQGLVIGGEGTDNMARVEKWEKTIASLPNSEWEAKFQGEFVRDSVFEDSIRTRFVPGKGEVVDTIKVFKGKMDTLSADTTSYFYIELYRDPLTFANTGHYYRRNLRTTYDRATKQETIVSESTKEYDFIWYFSEVSSDAKFTLVLESQTPGVAGDKFSISKYKADDNGYGLEFLLDGQTFKRLVMVPVP